MKTMTIWKLIRETGKKCFEATENKRSSVHETFVIRFAIVNNWLRNLYVDGKITLNDYQKAAEWARNYFEKCK